MTRPNTIRVSYAAVVYGQPEIRAVNQVLRDPERIVAGYRVKDFEKAVANLFGKRYGVMVNSGSSANLLALEVLNLPRGSEVITPVLTFSTTVSPMVKLGLTPVFIDVRPGRYVINEEEVEPAITRKTRALMIPSLIGNLPDLQRLRAIAQKYKLVLIDDSCDTLGATFAGKPIGRYSDISTTSFYASHMVTAAGGGGMVLFHDQGYASRARILSNWGRRSVLFGPHEKSEDLRKRFSQRLGGTPYDAKFIFNEMGYNFQPLELQAAFGLAQLRRLEAFSRIRKRNFARLFNFFRRYERRFILPEEHPLTKTNWLFFPLTIRDGARFSRLELTRHLEERNIQTRPIFSGNILRQPTFQHRPSRATSKGRRYPVADKIMRDGFLIGCHHGLTLRHLTYLENVFTKFLRNHE